MWLVKLGGGWWAKVVKYSKSRKDYNLKTSYQTSVYATLNFKGEFIQTDMETILPVKLSKLEVLRVVTGPAGSFLCCFHQTASINHTNDTPDLKQPTRSFSVVPTADTQIPTTTIRLMSTISSSHHCDPGKNAPGVSSLSCLFLCCTPLAEEDRVYISFRGC